MLIFLFALMYVHNFILFLILVFTIINVLFSILSSKVKIIHNVHTPLLVFIHLKLAYSFFFQCFSLGAEIGEHKNNHSYQFEVKNTIFVKKNNIFPFTLPLLFMQLFYIFRIQEG